MLPFPGFRKKIVVFFDPGFFLKNPGSGTSRSFTIPASRKREHVCEECGLDFWEEPTFKKHYRTMHGAGTQAPAKRAPAVFQCKYCDVKSGLASFIKRHTLEAHKGEMAWKCDKCERRYTNAQGLKRHLRLNHGSEEWPCPHCGKKFMAEDYMKDHVKRFCKLKGQLEKETESGEQGIGGGQHGQAIK